MEWRVTGDACVGDNDVDRTKISFDLCDASRAFFVVCDIPFVGFDTCFTGKFCGGFVVASVCGSDGVTGVF